MKKYVQAVRFENLIQRDVVVSIEPWALADSVAPGEVVDIKFLSDDRSVVELSIDESGALLIGIDTDGITVKSPNYTFEQGFDDED